MHPRVAQHVLGRAFSFRIDPKSLPEFPMSQLPADRESLQVLLARIHERLNEAGSVDAGSRQMLTQVMGDIERALAAQDVPPVATGANTSRLEALAVRFEAEHPALAATLRRLVDLLSEVGI
jgi:hypothetical protein